jgi:lipid-binding SYLF domain-containing protein
MIFPRVIKAGFIWGGSGGHGVLVARDEKGMVEPARVLQRRFRELWSSDRRRRGGGHHACHEKKAIDSLLASSFKFGGDVAVAAGPHGAGAKRILNADFVSFARTRGFYAGLNFEGSAVKVREDLNKAYYGKEVRPVQIIVERAASNPGSERLLGAVSKAPGKEGAVSSLLMRQER